MVSGGPSNLSLSSKLQGGLLGIVLHRKRYMRHVPTYNLEVSKKSVEVFKVAILIHLLIVINQIYIRGT